MYNKLTDEARAAVCELVEVSGIKAGKILVVGCSTSEAVGGTIGKNSVYEAASAIVDGIYPTLKEKGTLVRPILMRRTSPSPSRTT